MEDTIPDAGECLPISSLRHALIFSQTWRGKGWIHPWVAYPYGQMHTYMYIYNIGFYRFFVIVKVITASLCVVYKHTRGILCRTSLLCCYTATGAHNKTVPTSQLWVVGGSRMTHCKGGKHWYVYMYLILIKGVHQTAFESGIPGLHTYMYHHHIVFSIARANLWSTNITASPLLQQGHWLYKMCHTQEKPTSSPLIEMRNSGKDAPCHPGQ